MANQIARLLFQTLTKNDFKGFSEFLHVRGDDSLPSCTNCMPKKILVLKLWPKTLVANHCLTTILGSKNFSDFLFDVKPLYPNCMFRKTLVLKLHLTPNCCLKGQKLCCIYLFYIIYLHFIYLHIFYCIVFSSLWCYKSPVLSYVDNQKFLIGFDDCKVHETSNSETFFLGYKYKLEFSK